MFATGRYAGMIFLIELLQFYFRTCQAQPDDDR